MTQPTLATERTVLLAARALYRERSWAGDCYLAALTLADRVPKGARGVYVVHGTPVGQGAAAGGRMGHAWVEIGTHSVLDLTVRAEPMLRHYYYGVWQMTDQHVVRYTCADALARMTRTGNGGPWARLVKAARHANP